MLANVCQKYTSFLANVTKSVILAPKTWVIIQGLPVDSCKKENKTKSNFFKLRIFDILINFDTYEVVYYLS